MSQGDDNHGNLSQKFVVTVVYLLLVTFSLLTFLFSWGLWGRSCKLWCWWCRRVFFGVFFLSFSLLGWPLCLAFYRMSQWLFGVFCCLASIYLLCFMEWIVPSRWCVKNCYIMQRKPVILVEWISADLIYFSSLLCYSLENLHCWKYKSQLSLLNVFRSSQRLLMMITKTLFSWPLR